MSVCNCTIESVVGFCAPCKELQKRRIELLEGLNTVSKMLENCQANILEMKILTRVDDVTRDIFQANKAHTTSAHNFLAGLNAVRDRFGLPLLVI